MNKYSRESESRGAATLDELAAQRIAKPKNGLPESRAGNFTHAVDTKTTAATVNLVCASDITPEPINWIWPGWLAAGKYHLLAGQAGTGKTTIALSIAAIISNGGTFPDGARCQNSGNVIIWSGEDDFKDTLVPRLALAGAELRRVHFVDSVNQQGKRLPFDPARDIDLLAKKINEIGNVKLLIIDPIVSAIAGDSHKSNEVRRDLQPLVDLCHDSRCALIGITHFNKGSQGSDPLERVTGSLAFGALARVVWAAAKNREADENGAHGRVLCISKSNIGRDGGGFAYDLSQGEPNGMPGVHTSRIQWGEAVEGSAREILADVEGEAGDDGGAKADAEKFLVELLTDGAVPVKHIKADADGAGLAWRTVERAKKTIGGVARKTGGSFGGRGATWVWELPSQENNTATSPTRPPHKSMAILCNSGGLVEDSAIDAVEQEAEL